MFKSIWDYRSEIMDVLGYDNGHRYSEHLVNGYNWDSESACEMIESYALECSGNSDKIRLTVLERLTK